ncbi:uncharacterized protein BCR38DRAFT_226616 [Pseudomassariella vexata]|uniref:Uncharacterized protein n=1 Tax=Pseudomassariella vexata TaxID=1141098 RepID=A0A1Y2DVP0_9PEZI|nr:uncharacterized protein BCR38DRAFT_226616 [Pseudomassariella vexata]ORY63323.1 hypothetical protein BCR38DRAFT_226616 [Pseudomassariella vexata]
MPGISVPPPRRDHQVRTNIPTPRRSHLAGCIMWLPRKEDINLDIEIEDGCYNHPVVILSPQPKPKMVTLLLITSFNSTSLEAKHANDVKTRLKHLPIKPAESHPDNGKLLFLEDEGRPLRKTSWVKTETQHLVPLKVLRSYTHKATDYFLSQESYHELIVRVRLGRRQ